MPNPKVERNFVVLGDVISWYVAIAIAILIRYGFEWPGEISFFSYFLFAGVISLAQIVLGWLTRIYRGKHKLGSFYEIQDLCLVVFLVFLLFIVLTLLRYPHSGNLPRSIPYIALPWALVMMVAFRYIARGVKEKKLETQGNKNNVIIYGAGYLGNSIIRAIKTDPRTPYHPVTVIDDNLAKRGQRIDKYTITGSLDNLKEIAHKYDADTLLVAIARTDKDFLNKVKDEATEAGLTVKVFPPFSEVIDGQSSINDMRDLSVEDLIGRQPVDTLDHSITTYLRGKRVLVTGAGGSIGSELCRQVSRYEPAELMMLDRDESGLHGAQMSIKGHGLLDSKDVVLADIRDLDNLEIIFKERKPEVVFHAAALKHLPMLEQYPDEAWKTNVLGTLNVLTAAAEVDVETFVNISTDKAADPTSILGHSKRLAERLTSWFAETHRGKYLSVRFGNVMGSRGSMLPTFQKQIDEGGPVTVTHPEVTRYFMTIPEACQLVIQAGAIGREKEVLILDMGEPVKIVDVAQKMINASGKDIDIKYTGLREGEKLHEDLISENESDERPLHPKISHAKVPALAPDKIESEKWKESGNPALKKDQIAESSIERKGLS
ncbi:MAG: nucleoside-diphosphate sugar epimerase/dehydratase [Micrococcaceae bacterium]